MLDVVFALDGSLNVVVMLEVDEALDGIPLRKSRDQAIPVFIDSTNKVVGDPTYKIPLVALARM